MDTEDGVCVYLKSFVGGLSFYKIFLFPNVGFLRFCIPLVSHPKLYMPHSSLLKKKRREKKRKKERKKGGGWRHILNTRELLHILLSSPPYHPFIIKKLIFIKKLSLM
jgi:hypothetical protein